MKPSQLHAIPATTARPHESSPKCWCNPKKSKSAVGVWIHYAAPKPPRTNADVMARIAECENEK